MHFIHSLSAFSLSTSMADSSSNGTEATQVPVTKTVTFTAGKPQLFVEAPKANDAVEFFKAAFGAQELHRFSHSKRKADQEHPLLLAVELKIGSFSFLVSDLNDEATASVKAVGGGSVIRLETEDVEAAVAKAVSGGAISSDAEAEADGVVNLKDPYGNLWLICSSALKN